MEGPTLPAVLIINAQTMYKENATGITERSILKNYPSNRVFELYRWKTPKKCYDGLKIRSVQIPQSVLPADKLLRRITKNNGSTESTGSSAAVISGSSSAKSKKFKLKVIARVKFFGENHFINAKPIFELLAKENFVPDVIYTLGASQAIHKICLACAKHYKIKTVIHYMDNWRETAYMGVPKIPALNKAINKSASLLEKCSCCSLVISEGMKDAYSAKFSHSYRALMNCVDENNFKKPQKRSNKDEINIVYAGGLHLGRGEQLKKIEKAIEKAKDKTGKNIFLNIYTSEQAAKANKDGFSSEITRFYSYVPHEKIGEVYDFADILVHIEAFDEQTKAFTKYSLSTKISEYLGSGKPVLCFAPDDIEVFRYFKEHNAGITASNEEELIQGLLTLCTDENKCFEYANNGYALAEKYHGINATRLVFEQTMQDNT